MVYDHLQPIRWQSGCNNPLRGIHVWPEPDPVTLTTTMYKVKFKFHATCASMVNLFAKMEVIKMQYCKQKLYQYILREIFLLWFQNPEREGVYQDHKWGIQIKNVS